MQGPIQIFPEMENYRYLSILKYNRRIRYINCWLDKNLGSSALSGKILLVKMVENDKIDAYFRAG